MLEEAMLRVFGRNAIWSLSMPSREAAVIMLFQCEADGLLINIGVRW